MKNLCWRVVLVTFASLRLGELLSHFFRINIMETEILSYQKEVLNNKKCNTKNTNRTRLEFTNY